MDFFEHQAQARRKTSVLLFYFLVALGCIVLAVYTASALLRAWVLEKTDGASDSPLELFWQPELLAVVSVFTLALVAIGSVYKISMLRAGGGRVVARTLGGRLLSADRANLREKRLLNVVEEMAIASGIAVPPVYLLENESAINAFAAGFTAEDAVIGVTRGAIDSLSRDELQGVLGHEFSHILNGDMRLNLRLIGLLHGILLISLTGYWIFRMTADGRSSARDDNKKGGNPLPLFGLALYAIGYVGVIGGKLIKSAVSRQREFLADASSVQFTRNPEGIGHALIKIGGFVIGSRLSTPQAEEASHLFFSNALSEAWLGLMATHPPLAERIHRVLPNFDGRFPRLEPRRLGENDEPSPLVESGIAAMAAPQSTLSRGPLQVERTTEPAELVAEVGNPRPAHMEYARNLREQLPSAVLEATRDPSSASGLVFALVIAAENQRPKIPQLVALVPPAVRDATLTLVSDVANLPTEARLPVAGMCVPALRRLSQEQYQQFSDALRTIIRADQRVSLFEFAISRMLLRHVASQFEPPNRAEIRYRSWVPLVGSLGVLLGALARAGAARGESADNALRAAIESLGITGIRPQWGDSSLEAVDRALDTLSAAHPQLKRRIVAAAAVSILHDQRTTTDELELLRAICDALDCPLPPLLSS